MLLRKTIFADWSEFWTWSPITFKAGLVFRSAFSTMPLRGLIHLRLKLLRLWLHIVARRGEAVVSTVTKLPPRSSSQYGFVLIDTHGFVCTRNSHFYLRQWASFQFPEWLFLRRPDSPRVIDFYLLRSTKNTPGHVFHAELKTEVVYSMVWKYKQTHKYTQLCKCDTRPEKCAIYGSEDF